MSLFLFKYSRLMMMMIIIIIIHEFHGDTSLKQNFRAADSRFKLKSFLMDLI